MQRAAELPPKERPPTAPTTTAEAHRNIAATRVLLTKLFEKYEPKRVSEIPQILDTFGDSADALQDVYQGLREAYQQPTALKGLAKTEEQSSSEEEGDGDKSGTSSYTSSYTDEREKEEDEGETEKRKRDREKEAGMQQVPWRDATSRTQRRAAIRKPTSKAKATPEHKAADGAGCAPPSPPAESPHGDHASNSDSERPYPGARAKAKPQSEAAHGAGGGAEMGPALPVLRQPASPLDILAMPSVEHAPGMPTTGGDAKQLLKEFTYQYTLTKRALKQISDGQNLKLLEGVFPELPRQFKSRQPAAPASADSPWLDKHTQMMSFVYAHNLEVRTWSLLPEVWESGARVTILNRTL